MREKLSGILSIIKAFLWDMTHPYGKIEWLQFLAGAIPGDCGFELRRRLLCRHMKRFGENLCIYPGARIIGIWSLSVGDNVQIGASNMIQASGGVELGNNVMTGPGVKIWSINHKYQQPDIPIHSQGWEKKPVIIGDDVWAGANVLIMPGANIGKGCVISACSVVGGKTIPPYTILAGNPARKIGVRKR